MWKKTKFSSELCSKIKISIELKSIEKLKDEFMMDEWSVRSFNSK